MAEKLDEKEVVSSQELLMSQMIQLDAVSQLLIEEGIITEEEFVAKLKQVQHQYESLRAVKGQLFNLEEEVVMSLFTDRMIRAAKLDVNVYEEVEADKSAMGQAMWVVGLSSVAAGIGSIGTTGIYGLLIGTIVALIGWFVWAFITYFVGTKILPEPQTSADYGELLRTIGFSSSPGVIRILGIIPFLGGVINIIAGIWMLIAMVIAVRQALDYKSTGRAVGVCLIGWIIQFIIFFGAFFLFGGGGQPS